MLRSAAQSASQPAAAMAAALQRYDAYGHAAGAAAQLSGNGDAKSTLLQRQEQFFGVPKR